jgi:hypothetical protein
MTEQGELFAMAAEPRTDRGEPSRSKWGGSVATAARKLLAATLPAPCWRCGVMLTKDSKWTVGHLEDRTDGGSDNPANLAPECSRCNYSAGGKRGAAITNGRKVEAVDLTRFRRVKWW